ncbi:MAG TPA: hypothetical protein VK335_24405 [Bryobacteraceae bacterium]|nr:hypothetical protein [Bryobacteraceae bacterium]
MRAKPILLAVLASLPLGLVAVSAVVQEVRDLSDPCLHWGDISGSGSGVILSSSARPAGPCAMHGSGTSETKAGAMIRTLLVPGGILAAIVLGVLGAARSRQRLVRIGACLMLVEAVPLIFSVAPLALLAGGVFLWVANRLRLAGSPA